MSLSVLIIDLSARQEPSTVARNSRSNAVIAAGCSKLLV